MRFALPAVSAALAVTSALALFMLVQVNRMADEGDAAFSRELAASAVAQLPIDPELSLLLAREAFVVRPTDEAEAALRRAVLESRVRAALRGHQGSSDAVAFSADGSDWQAGEMTARSGSGIWQAAPRRSC
ncbi:MAG: hypothetical protein ACRD0K_05805 [Egibacteraceae bacterium]